MKDLYRRIGLSARTDDRASIEKAIANCSNVESSSMRAARHILLDPQRKAVYDRTHEVVRRIGQLRANLGLSRAPNGLATDCADFETAPTSTVSQLDALRSRLNPERRTAGMTPRHWIGLSVAALLIGSCIISGVLNESSQRSSASSPRTPPQRAHTEQWRQAPLSPERGMPSGNKPQPPVETKAERLRKLATKRMERAGLTPDALTINAAVQKLMGGQTDPLPITGVMRKNFYGAGVAPLEIRTRFGSNYFIKVLDWTTKKELLTVFIRGGQPFETTVPVGSYEIKYAAGQDWFGPILDFGEGASYSRCDDRFDFTESYNGYSGYTIELILQQNGNLETDPISADEF